MSFRTCNYIWGDESKNGVWQNTYATSVIMARQYNSDPFKIASSVYFTVSKASFMPTSYIVNTCACPTLLICSMDVSRKAWRWQKAQWAQQSRRHPIQLSAIRPSYTLREAHKGPDCSESNRRRERCLCGSGCFSVKSQNNFKFST